jgi:hypothetical protein
MTEIKNITITQTVSRFRIYSLFGYSIAIMKLKGKAKVRRNRK